jgi:peptide/nickel transport system permease protein
MKLHRLLLSLFWRVLQTVPVIIAATFIVFLLLHLVPGDPAVALAGENPTEQHIEVIRHLYGFDRPFIVQYLVWLWHALGGDLGQSTQSDQPVLALILHSLPNTMIIVGYALVIGTAAGALLGALAAVSAGSVLDSLVTVTASLGVALPGFWLAMMLVSVFALQLRWLPAVSSDLTSSPLAAFLTGTLPAVALAFGVMAQVARQLRNALAEVLASQYARTLRAKGLSQRSVVWKHGLKNVGVTMITLVGLMVNHLLSITVVIEAVFAIPGIGTLIVNAAVNRDYAVVQGVVLFMVIIVVLVNFLVDALCLLVDPRTRDA